MKVIVNGTERELADGTTVLSLLESLRLSPDKVAVELNRRLLRSANYDRVLQAGDQVEVVTFVGGG
jgi:thiamine biosynthesis protein ThiS